MEDAERRVMRLAIVASHPVQYYAPLYRALARQLDVTVFYAHQASAADQARPGFGQGFTWDVDLLSGYQHRFLQNVSKHPGLGRFTGVDTPGVAAELDRGRFDAVLLMGWYLKAFVQALWAAKRARLPVLVRGDSQLDTPRHWLKRAAKELAYPIFLRQFDAALVVGQRNRQYWRHYRFPSERQFASPHCVDTDWFAARADDAARQAVRGRFGIGADVPVALFAGKLVPFKRPVDVVRAAALVRASGVPLEVLVAGAGELQADVQAAASKTGVPCHLMGFCNQSEMPSAYAAADVLVLPSNGRETWGLVANEALACGRPLVLSDAVGCAGDLAAGGTAARVYPCGDVEALGQALVTVIKSPPSRDQILERSQAHSIQVAAAGIVEAMSDAVARRRGAPAGWKRSA